VGLPQRKLFQKYFNCGDFKHNVKYNNRITLTHSKTASHKMNSTYIILLGYIMCHFTWRWQSQIPTHVVH